MKNLEIRSHFLYSLYEGSLEILGAPEANRVFSTAVGWNGSGIPDQKVLSTNFLANIGSEFSINFHQNTAKGLLVRIGDASFPFLRKRIDMLNHLGMIENRLKPLNSRFSDAISVLADCLTEIFGVSIQVNIENETKFCLDFPQNSTGVSGDLSLYFIGGVLRAFGAWLDSRKAYSFTMAPADSQKMMDRVCLQVQEAE